MKITKSQLKQTIKEELEAILDEGWFSPEPPPIVQGDQDLGWIFAEHKLSAKNLNHPLAKIFLNADESLIKKYASLTRQVGGARVAEKKDGEGDNIEEGWKDIALAGLMATSAMAAPAQAMAAAPTKTHAVAEQGLANKLKAARGRRTHDNWLNPKYWSEQDIDNEPLAAFIEVMEAVKSHWTSTVPNQYMGCGEAGAGAATAQCEILRKITKKAASELGPLIKIASTRQGRSLQRSLETKLKSALDRWVPTNTRANSIFDTEIWKESAKGTFVDYDED